MQVMLRAFPTQVRQHCPWYSRDCMALQPRGGMKGQLRDGVMILHWQVRAQGEQVQRASRAARLGAVLGAEAVASTLSGAGGDLLGLLQEAHAFDTLVIDEACRSPPWATPHLCTQCLGGSCRRSNMCPLCPMLVPE